MNFENDEQTISGLKFSMRRASLQWKRCVEKHLFRVAVLLAENSGLYLE